MGAEGLEAWDNGNTMGAHPVKTGAEREKKTDNMGKLTCISKTPPAYWNGGNLST
jgi:hypothetical protein